LPVLYANQIGTLAAQALDSDEGATVGEIIATFAHSFYVKTRDDQLLFFTNQSFHSPITVNVPYSGSFTDVIKPLEPLYVNGRRLYNSNLSIEFTNNPQPAKKKVSINNNPNYVNLTNASNLLSTILNVIETAGSVLDRDQLTVHDSIANFVKEGILPLRTKEDLSKFAAAASEIIGLGSGFTPSGDDFLLGFLVIYNSLARVVARTPIYIELEQLTQRTNWISAKLVDYAQHLQLDEHLRLVVQTISNRYGDIVTALETLIPRGHTSGIDITTGATFGLSVACDIALGQRKTEVIATKLGFQCLDSPTARELILNP